MLGGHAMQWDTSLSEAASLLTSIQYHHAMKAGNIGPKQYQEDDSLNLIYGNSVFDRPVLDGLKSFSPLDLTIGGVYRDRARWAVILSASSNTKATHSSGDDLKSKKVNISKGSSKRPILVGKYDSENDAITAFKKVSRIQ
jgi:hypothetical protein